MPRVARPFGWLLLAATWLAVVPLVAWGGERGASFALALESIRTDQLKAHVDYLADDALQGREAGTPGNRAAGEHLADRLGELGLRGAGVDGGFFQPFEPNYRNVLARLEGSDPQKKSQYVVVGAHYDHIGYGTKRNSRGQVGQIHNGADDNASGTSALLEVAGAFTFLPQTPKRSILFALWDAEEKGMRGSKHWIRHPVVPLEQVAVMVNLDMVGRLRDDRIMVYGTRSGYGWRRLVSRANDEVGLKIQFPWDLRANSDHWTFFDRGVPVVMLHTGLHDDYHRPTDDAYRINPPGMRRAARLLFAITYDLAMRDELPSFREAAAKEAKPDARKHGESGPPMPVRLGVEWQAGDRAEQGVRLTHVAEGSPAERVGLRPGDQIIEIAGRKVRTGDDLSWIVASAQPSVSIKVRRVGHDGPLELSGRLDGEPLRLGLRWRRDEAEPGTLVVTHVVRGSPAATTGLRPGDRVYQIGGRDFDDEEHFARLARTLPAPLTLLVERDGRLHTVEIPVEGHSQKRAA